jgi:hypothetical protein
VSQRLAAPVLFTELLLLLLPLWLLLAVAAVGFIIGNGAVTTIIEDSAAIG